MTSPTPMLAFEAARRRHLMEATIETLAEVGFRAASLSEIARRANVSTGLFAHYFGDKDGLLEATLRFMAARLAKETATRLATSKTRRERLYAVCDAALADEEFDRRTSAVWLAFWGQMAHSKRYQRVQRVYQRRMITNLRHGLRGMVSPGDVALTATMIAAMIDGLWLRSQVAIDARGETDRDGAAVRAVVHAFIDGLLTGSGTETAPIAGTRPIAVAPPPPARDLVRHVSPVTGEEMACYRPARAAEVRGALHDARQGLAAWRAHSGLERARILSRCADLMRAEGPDLARFESLETGRPVRHTGGRDLPEAIRVLEQAERHAEATLATTFDLGAGRIGQRRCDPLGLVAAPAHWSAAILGLCEQAIPLAAGNAVIVVPSPGALRTAARVADLFARAGLPEGTLTVLPGDAETMSLLEQHAETASGGGSARRPQALDLGAGVASGKAATIILPGADVGKAAAAILSGRGCWLASTFPGQNRVYVHADAAAPFREALCAAAATMRAGDPLDPLTEIGLAHSPAHADGLAEALRADLEAGAEPVLPPGRQGARIGASPGLLILDRCRDAMALVRGHSFAPVVTLLPFAGAGDDLRSGLADPSLRVGIFGGEPGRAWALAEALGGAYCALDPTGADEAFGWSAGGQADRSLSRSVRIVGRAPPWGV